MSNYTQVTFFGPKDSLSTGDPLKIARGTQVDAELSLIATAIASKLDSSGYTAADVLSKLLTVDGAGSTLDSDLLDGQQGAYYLALANATGTLALANGGTGATSAATARTALGVTATGSDTTYAYRANNLSDLASASTARTNLGLGSMATQAASSVSISGGSISGITDLAVVDGGTGSSSASGARTNLGLGSIATKNITVSTSDPSGTPGDGDLWIKYTP